MRDQSTPTELSKRVIHYLNYRAASKFALTDEVRNDELYWQNHGFLLENDEFMLKMMSWGD